jgi:tetratricopeptide (TPR) repeat protein
MKSRPQATVCVALAELEKQCGDIEQAKRVLREGLQTIKFNRERILLFYSYLEETVLQNTDEAEKLLEYAFNIAPHNVKVHIARANIAQRRGRFDEARAILNSTTSMHADDGQHYNAWATLETQQNNLDVAVAILAEGHRKFPADQFLLQRWGTIEEKRGNLTGARQLYEKSVALKPHAATFVSWAILEEDLGRQRLAKTDSATNKQSVSKFLQEISLEGTRVLSEPYQTGVADFTEIPFDEGEFEVKGENPSAVAFAFAQSKFKLSRELYERGVKADPRHGPLYNAYGKIEASLGNVDRAREIYRQGIAANCQECVSVYHGWGVLELNNGQYGRARQLLTQGIEKGWTRDKGDVSFLLHSLGMLELDQHNLARAMEVFQMGVDRYPKNSQLSLGAAMTCVRLGMVHEARNFFRRSLENDRKHAHAWQAWALMEKRERNVEASRALFNEGLNNCPTHAALYQGLAVLEIMQRNYTQARNLFATALSKCPSHAQSLQAWACLEVRLGNLGKAKELAKEGLRKRPAHAALWTVYGLIMHREGETSRARKVFTEAIHRFPTHGVLYRVLGQVEEQDGNYKLARKIFKKGVKVRPCKKYVITVPLMLVVQADPYNAQLYHSLALLEAKFANLDGLSELHQKAKEYFNPDPARRNKPPAGGAEDDVISRIRQVQIAAIGGACRITEAIADENLVDIDIEID